MPSGATGATGLAPERWVQEVLADRTLVAHVNLPRRMVRAVETNMLNPEVVIIDARRTDEQHVASVVPIGELDRYDRPASSLLGYDELLSRRAMP